MKSGDEAETRGSFWAGEMVQWAKLRKCEDPSSDLQNP